MEVTFLSRCDEIIRANLANPLFGVSELADALNTSQSTLLRKVKKTTGRTVANYIIFTRLETSRSLLENSEKTISEISFEVGFNDLSHFSTSFKKVYGFPPSDLRK